jgi:AcrR family transcriptional regulator
VEPMPDAIEQLRNEVAVRALRADAKRNLESILEAAAAEFAEHGLEACVADIAHRAGVGQATIFRRFETKDELILAVVERKLEAMLAVTAEAGERKRAWDGLRELMETAVEQNMRDRGLFEAVHERLKGDPRLLEKKAKLLEAVSGLVARAKAEGDLRRDVAPEDFPMLIAAAAQAGVIACETDPELWRRYLQIMLDGLRPEGRRGRLPRAAAKPA